MTPAPWETRNNTFLRAALDWLRLRVRRATAVPAVSPLLPVPVVEPPGRSGGDGKRWRNRSAQPAIEASPPERPGPTDAQIEAAREAMEAAAAGDPPPALEMLCRRTGLSPFERDVVLLAAAPEFDTSFGRLYADAQGDPTRRQATFALAMAVFDDPLWEALAPHRPLRRLELVTVGAADGLVAAPLRVPERVVNFVKGLSHLDAALAELLVPFDVDGPADVAPSQQAAVEKLVATGGVANLVGVDRPSKQLVAAAAAARWERRLMRLPVARIIRGGQAGLDRLLEREQLLSPVVLYLDAGDAGPEELGDASEVDRLLATADGPVLIDSREPWPGLPQRATIVDVARPTATEQRAEWEGLLGDPDAAAATAAEFDLDLGLIHAVAAATADSGPDAQARTDAVRQACNARCRPRLGGLAERLVPRAAAASLVLPDDVSAQLRALEEQVRFRSTVLDDWGMARQSARGLGTTALFTGEPGTGKTLAAEVLAGRLDLDLYRIDLSGVVSKYIGETEKNLRAVFDAADRGGCVLFFDEADALFGKRSEVRDSHDRYANVEVSYLLARMETHRGLAILATNLKRGMDEAFLRRLRVTVEFPFPGEAERAGIWAAAFPPDAVLRGIDNRRLARLTLAGGAIRNVAVNAAFRGAAATPPGITMSMVLDAARAEYRKLGLPAGPADFAWTEPEVAP